MSIGAMLRIGITGLNTHQQVLRNVSNNIVNVNTEGYDRKITTLKQEIAGAGAWVFQSHKFNASPIRFSPARYRFPDPIPRTWKSRLNFMTGCRRSLARRIRTSH